MSETIGELYDRLPGDGTPVELPEHGVRAWRPAPVPPGPCRCPDPEHHGEDDAGTEA